MYLSTLLEIFHLVHRDKPMQFIVSSLLLVSSCMAEETVSDERITNSLHWPATQIGQTAVVNCNCGNITIASASRFCGGDIVTGAAWENVNDSDCRLTKIVGDICQLVTADVRVL